ncbi:MAG: DNA methyltransferase [Planctomycetes bacterium]|nr:DNA methyltransferase [Planctomycetota bacterium]
MTNAVANALRIEDRSAHEWYRFVLSFPPHLVRDYVERFGLGAGHRVLDPFCGTGTTLVECKKLGVPSVGIESNPVASFASRVKVRWNVDPRGLVRHAREAADVAFARLRDDGIDDDARGPLFQTRRMAPLRRLPDEAFDILLTNSISPRPLHKVLVLLDAIKELHDDRFTDHERLALAKALVFGISNLHFGPEVGVKPPKPDATVVAAWMGEVRAMAEDLGRLREAAGVESVVHQGDAREIGDLLPPRSVDAVITSPPYPNEKDYTRTTRLESVLLGFITSKKDLRALKKRLVRSNTRSVYTSDRDDLLVADNAEIQRIARDIEARRIEMGKTSGFERLYARVTRLYFGGMARHLADLRRVLRPGARLAYVVGDQASYLRVMIRTGQLLADIAASLGYHVEGIDLFRTRLATATRDQLREEVVVLRWPGDPL